MCDKKKCVEGNERWFKHRLQWTVRGRKAALNEAQTDEDHNSTTQDACLQCGYVSHCKWDLFTCTRIWNVNYIVSFHPDRHTRHAITHDYFKAVKSQRPVVNPKQLWFSFLHVVTVFYHQEAPVWAGMQCSGLQGGKRCCGSSEDSNQVSAKSEGGRGEPEWSQEDTEGLGPTIKTWTVAMYGLSDEGSFHRGQN